MSSEGKESAEDAKTLKSDAKLLATFKEVTARKHQDQAVFFLNAFWPDLDTKEAENTWGFCQTFIELDKNEWGALPEGKKSETWSEGASLDEFWSHKFLEKYGKTLTVIQLRDTLKKIDLDFDKRMSMVEFLLFHYGFDVKTLLSRPQGTNEELKKAQQALGEVKKEIDAIEKKKADLEAKVAAGGVKGNTAKNELEQLLNSDPTNLNRAIVTAEAAVRKAQKATGLQPQGALYWIDRELQESKKYKPKSKGGTAK